MEDYIEEIKNLLLRFYERTGKEHHLLQRTTSEVLNELRGLIPQNPIDEHNIYEILKELQFQQDLKIVKEKVCTFEGNEKAGIPKEYEEIESYRLFVWNLYQK